MKLHIPLYADSSDSSGIYRYNNISIYTACIAARSYHWVLGRLVITSTGRVLSSISYDESLWCSCCVSQALSSLKATSWCISFLPTIHKMSAICGIVPLASITDWSLNCPWCTGRHLLHICLRIVHLVLHVLYKFYHFVLRANATNLGCLGGLLVIGF